MKPRSHKPRTPATGGRAPSRTLPPAATWAPAPRGPLDWLAVPFLATLLVAVARMPILTPDVWWHLATGRLIARDGIPHRDPFSYTLGERAWTVHEWLADRLLFASYEGAELLGVVLLRAGLITAACAMAYVAARRRGGVFVTLALLGPAAWATQRNWLDRPQLWSFVLAPLVLWMLETHRGGGRRVIFVLPVVFAFWVNVHGGFMLGLGIVALWILGEAWRARIDAGARAGLRSLLIAAGAAAVCTLANPNHIEGALYPLKYVASGLGETLQEERPGTLDSGYAWVHFSIALALLAALASRVRSVVPQHLALGLVLIWISMPRLGGVALPFAAERHAPLLLLLGTPLLVWQLAIRWPAWGASERRLTASRKTWRVTWGAGLVLALASVALAVRALPRERGVLERVAPARFPQAAADWLRTNHLAGNLINPYRWGGHLAFHLYPDYRVWIDSRGDLYGVERIREAEILHRMPAGAERFVSTLLERYDANVIVWHLLTIDFGPLQVHPFADWLLRSPDWRLVFFDRATPGRPDRPSATTGVFLREHPRNAALLERYPPARTPRLPRAGGAGRRR